MKINDFFILEYLNYASYDNFRKIGSLVDGLKPSARKCIYTIMLKNITAPKKLSSLKALVADTTEYIHGDTSLIGVMVNMAQNFVGSNNIPLLKREGNFGNRCKQVASADRYIFTAKENYLDFLFMKDDDPVLTKQMFEGTIIEYRHYMPILPLLLINGSEGLSVGFAQKILARNPVEIVSCIKKLLNDEELTEKLIPYYRGFTGTIAEREEGGFEFRGSFKKEGQKLIIDELPIGYDLASYLNVLNTLEEKKIILNYKDLSDTKKDKFRFEIKYKDLYTKTDNEILEDLKLIKRVSENFTVMDENNIIKVFDNPFDILKHFVSLRLEYYEKRKTYKIEKIEKDLLILKNKLMFIKDVVSNKIVISNKTKKDITETLESLKYYTKIEDSFDYLLRMQIYSLTSEKINELKELFIKTNSELEELKNKNIKEWYSEDIDLLMSKLGNF